MTYGQGATTGKHIHDHDHAHCGIRCISWTAIFTGAIVGIGLSFLFNLFSVAIGLSVFTMSEGIAGLAVGGLIGLAISAIVAMFLAGMVAGYLGRPYCFRRNLGILYGFTTWCLALILTALLTSYVGRYVVSYSNFIANPTVIVAEVAPAAANEAHANMVSTERAANTFGVGAFVVFVLFFIGAVASCFGGHCGMVCKDKEYEESTTR